MEQGTFCEANSSSASAKIARLLWNSKAYYRMDKNPPLNSIASQAESYPHPHILMWRDYLGNVGDTSC